MPLCRLLRCAGKPSVPRKLIIVYHKQRRNNVTEDTVSLLPVLRRDRCSHKKVRRMTWRKICYTIARIA
jgi:hypothetical protein